MLTNWEGRAFVIRGENHFATSNAPSAFTRMTFSKLEGVMSESLFSGARPSSCSTPATFIMRSTS